MPEKHAAGPIDGEPKPQNAGLLCARCGLAVGESWVYLQAISLARRLYQLDTCGPCWDMLKGAIAVELAGGGPGGHFETRPAPPSSSPADGVAQAADELADGGERQG